MKIKSLKIMTILVLFLSILGLFLLSFFTYNRNYTNGDFDSFSQDALSLLKKYTFDEDIIIPTDNLEKNVIITAGFGASIIHSPQIILQSTMYTICYDKPGRKHIFGSTHSYS